MNAAFANTLSYYYGYSTPDFGSYQTADALSSQNVSLAPQVPLVTVASQSQGSSVVVSTVPSVFTQAASVNTAVAEGYSIMVQSYGYSVPATSTTVSVGSGTLAVSGSVVVATAYTPSVSVLNVASTYNPSVVATVSSYYATPSYSAVVVSTAATASVSSASVGGYSNVIVSVGQVPASNSSQWGGVVVGVAPAYTPTTVTVAQTSTSANLSAGLGSIPTIGNPEPATLLFVASGLALVFWKRRRA